MVSTTIAQWENKTVILSFDDVTLHISPYGSDKDAWEAKSYALGRVYGVQFDDKENTSLLPFALRISVCIITTPSQQEGGDRLTNVKYKAAVWERDTLEFHVIEENSSSLPTPPSLHLPVFAEHLRNKVLPDVSITASTKVNVVLNAHSGQHKALGYWTDIVKPMLLIAGYTASHITVNETLQGNGTRAIAHTLGSAVLSTESPSMVICMGGDGTVHEVVNGLLDAYDQQQKDTRHRPTQSVFRLGIVPCGSGNAFSLSLKLASIEQSVLQIIKGKTEAVRLTDISFGHAPTAKDTPEWFRHITYRTDLPPLRILVVLSWGFHAQVVAQAQAMDPALGNVRFAMVAMKLLENLQHTSGEVVMINARRYNRSEREFQTLQEGPTFVDGSHGNGFTYFLVSKQASLEPGFCITPFASHSSDEVDVLLIQQATAAQLTDISLKASQGGLHVDDDRFNIDYYKTSELILRVHDAGQVCLDGEIYTLEANGIVHSKVIGPLDGNIELRVFS
ncbi:ATP-NAD kinase-like domain-containing protein [Spinellus fusiger]|nr:ATP-NAD kinase-like domain-containing protein [Spinellus fusiger]